MRHNTESTKWVEDYLNPITYRDRSPYMQCKQHKVFKSHM